jgi:aminoglycoside phosphotransferase (APT) family kinase protein
VSDEPQPRGIDTRQVSDWVLAHVPEACAPFAFRLIAAGGSNLSYLVEDARGVRRILRRPPSSAALATAHDMHREWRIMTALGTHRAPVPVPRMLAFCDDESVTGAHFYVMEFVDGLILRDRAGAAHMDAAACTRAMHSLVATQAALHTLDPAAVGLDELGRHGGYVARQLKRWRGQVEASATRDLPLLGQIHERLAANIPAETCRPALAHGDYRLDNVVLGADFRVRAVLDWELCTIGDPVADFFWSLMYWSEPGDGISLLPDPPTCAPQFPPREALIACYAEHTGFDLGDREFHTAFGWWKQACIVEGVYARLVRGAAGGMKTAPPARVAAIVERYLDCAAAALG